MSKQIKVSFSCNLIRCIYYHLLSIMCIKYRRVQTWIQTQLEKIRCKIGSKTADKQLQNQTIIPNLLSYFFLTNQAKLNSYFYKLMDKKAEQHIYFTAIASSLASVISKFLIYPIETIKTKVQVNTATKPYTPGLIASLIKKTFQQQGAKGFFRGAAFASIGSAPAICLYMTTYQISKGQLGSLEFFKSHQTTNHMISGFMAELVSCVFWLPLDIIKERLQSQSQFSLKKYKGPGDALTSIQKQQGTRGLYKAYGGTLAYFGCFSMLYFAIYEKMKSTFNPSGEKPQFLKSFAMAAASGITAGIACNPIDLAKIRMQVDRRNIGESTNGQLFGYRNVFHGIYKIYKTQGFFGLYKGSLIRIWTTGPITGLIMGFTEYFRRKLKETYA